MLLRTFLQNLVRESNRLMGLGLQQKFIFEQTLKDRQELEPFLCSLGSPQPPKRPRPDV